MGGVILETGLLLSLGNSLENASLSFTDTFVFHGDISCFRKISWRFLCYCDEFHTIYSHVRNALIWNRDGLRGIDVFTFILCIYFFYSSFQTKSKITVEVFWRRVL